MAVTENARHKLYQRLESVIGPDEADTIMELLPPVGWSQVATKDDLHQLEARLDSRFESLDGGLRHEIASLGSRFESLDGSLHHEIASLGTELRSEMVALEARIGVGMADLRTEMHRSLRSNLLATIGALTAVNSALAAIITLA